MNKKEIKNLIELLDKGSNRRTATYNKLMLKNYKEALIYTRQELQNAGNDFRDFEIRTLKHLQQIAINQKIKRQHSERDPQAACL